jgi:hypothetical protein
MIAEHKLPFLWYNIVAGRIVAGLVVDQSQSSMQISSKRLATFCDDVNHSCVSPKFQRQYFKAHVDWVYCSYQCYRIVVVKAHNSKDDQTDKDHQHDFTRLQTYRPCKSFYRRTILNILAEGHYYFPIRIGIDSRHLNYCG